MNHQYDIGPYDPCPCGSGKKYKFCCGTAAKANRHGKYPIGTIACYGPDDKITTKIAAGVILSDHAEPIIQRWVAVGVATDPKVAEEIKQFFARYGVKSVVATDGNIGCPHEEGIDFPNGRDCPLCPFWAGKQGTARRDTQDECDDYDDDVEEDDDAQSGFEILDPEDEDEDEEEEEEEFDFEAHEARVQAIMGELADDAGMEQAIRVFFDHLKANLQLPCEVTGIEDFRWEEPYVFGAFSNEEYERLKRTQPSFEDRYLMLGLELNRPSEWMLFPEDVATKVKRVSDGKKFVLGLAELKATDPNSPNSQLMEDYSYWFFNSQ